MPTYNLRSLRTGNLKRTHFHKNSKKRLELDGDIAIDNNETTNESKSEGVCYTCEK